MSQLNTMHRFFLAASALALSSSTLSADWYPSSPLAKLGDDFNLFLDSSAYFEVTDNLYSGHIKKSATQWLVTPGFSLEYGKNSALTAILKGSRTFVNFNKSEFRNLEDDRDALSLNLAYASGGPLKLTLDSAYSVSARNDDLQLQGVNNSVIGATLVRQANYQHAFNASYKLTERISVGLGFANTFNQYLDPVIQVSGGASTYNTNSLTELSTNSIPLYVDYLAFEKLSFGLLVQNDRTTYSNAPYYNSLGVRREALAFRNLEKLFTGITVKGQLTESGKLNGTIRLGFNRFNYDSISGNTDPSYSISINHSLTERFKHSVSLSRDISASTTNGRIESETYSYSISYKATGKLDYSLSVTRADVLVNVSDALTTIDSYVYGLKAIYKLNDHLSLQAGYAFSDANSSNATSTFDSNVFSLSASFRY